MNQLSLANCEKALEKLTQFLKLAEAVPNEAVQAGVIQAFEFTFEVFWKIFQKLGQAEGAVVAGPKSALSYAFQAELIENEVPWLDLLNDRNLTTHVYHEQLAQEIFEHIKNTYVHEFRKVYQKLLAHR
jgi:nucleotidyltransferase substrate binding protein (TIGR01987 family)